MFGVLAPWIYVPNQDGRYDLVRVTDIYPNVSVDKSMLVMNYLDFMPIELRFDTKPEDINRSFTWPRACALASCLIRIHKSSILRAEKTKP